MEKIHNISVVDSYKDEIADLMKKIKKSTEFEVDFNMDKTSSINYEKYVSLMEYLTYRKTSKKLDMTKSITLDINYSKMIGDELRENYRITVTGKDIINKYINMFQSRHSHVIFNTFIGLAIEGKSEEQISVYLKTKQMEDMIDIPELNVRVRLANEKKLSKTELSKIDNLDYTQQASLAFRLKQRITIILEETTDYVLQIDLTNAKTTNHLARFEQTPAKYEMELEYFSKSEHKPKILQRILDETVSLLKVVQRSNYIITKSETEKVMNEYRRLLNLGDKRIVSLEGRQPMSLEIQHATDKLANKYAVTDKADGERYFLIIFDKHVYLISQNLIVKDTGIILKKSTNDGTLLDGEYVFLPKYGRHLFMVFDCMFSKNQDIRKEISFVKRLDIARQIIDDCFILGKQKGFTYTDSKKNTVDSLIKHHTEQLDAFIDVLYNDIELEKKYPLVRTKYFIPVTGVADNEIFKYTMIIWNKYMYGKVKYPYMLDGTVYHPLLQAYVTDIKMSNLSEYKWKPSENNSIDFYVQFAKDKTTGKVLDVYDNAAGEQLENKLYRICYLNVGKKSREGEVPVHFNEDKKLHIALLFLQDGTVRDKEGNIIQDNTVVEFYYNNDLELNERFRWTPMRTRYDKTEMVQKYKIKYGNNSDVANRIWRSIMVPVRIIDIKTLTNDDMYRSYLDEMRSRMTEEMRIAAAKENVYYQIKSDLAKPMRQFHNWIKSIMIHTYMSPTYNQGKQLSVLDVGCGRGGDIMKFYHAHIANGVGIDPSYDGLHNASDGAISRYNKSRINYPAAPKIQFICADFTVPMNVDDQVAVIEDKSPANSSLMNRVFPKTGMTQFDRMNVQFAFHYFLANESAWKNACDNINKCLKPGGYMIVTAYDAQRVLDAFGTNPKYTLYYTVNGEKKILTDIVKKFPDNLDRKKIGVGIAIDVYNALISNEETYITEYLVDKDFITEELHKRCNMELVDTALFEDQFEMHRESIRNQSKYDMNLETRKNATAVYEYYNQTDEFNAECFKITRLNRMFVFRKKY